MPPKPKKGSPKKKAPKKGPRSRSSSRKRKGKPKNAAASPAPTEDVRTVRELEGGIVPLFLTTMTQQIFDIIPDVNVTRSSRNVFLSKASIIEDIHRRKGISDFYPMREIIMGYPSEEILVVYDVDFEFGENFFVCSTEEAKDRIMFQKEEVEEINPFALPDIPYIPPESKPWKDLGSGIEVEDQRVVQQRPKINISIAKGRKYLGRKCKFQFANSETHKEMYAEYVPVNDRKDVVPIKEIDTGVQAVPELVEKCIGTNYAKPMRMWTQYVPRELSEAAKDEIMRSPEMADFLGSTIDIMSRALLQNEIADNFSDQWTKLGAGKRLPTDGSDMRFVVGQSFQDFVHSKGRQIVCNEWHPTIPGVVGFSCIERMSFEERVKNSSRLSRSQSFVLLWNIRNAVHPRLMLEAPDDCMVFRFNPVNPALVAGGCMNGRIVLWDLGEYQSHLAMTDDDARSKKPAFLDAFLPDEDADAKAPRVHPVAVSRLAQGSLSYVTDIQWLLPPYALDGMGKLLKHGMVKPGLECHQFLSCSGDDHFFVWELMNTSTRRPSRVSSLYSGDEQWLHLHRNWNPYTRVFLPQPARGSCYSISKFCFHYAFDSDKAESEKHDEDKDDEESGRAVEDLTERSECPIVIYAGTFAGELLVMDLKVKKDTETNRMALTNLVVSPMHAEVVNCVKISPFCSSLLLTAGGFKFAVWKTHVADYTGPMLLMSYERPSRCTAASWSSSRGAVFFGGCANGSLEAWDLLDVCHQPVLTKNLSGVRVTGMHCVQLGRLHTLSVSDDKGSQHLLQVPLPVVEPQNDELALLEELVQREIAHRSEIVEWRSPRETHPEGTAGVLQPLGGDLPQGSSASMPSITDYQWDDYQSYLELEADMLAKLEEI